MEKRKYIENKAMVYKASYQLAMDYLGDIMDEIDFVGFEEDEPDFVIVSMGELEIKYQGVYINLKDIIPYIKENGEFTKDDWDKIVKLTTKEP